MLRDASDVSPYDQAVDPLDQIARLEHLRSKNTSFVVPVIRVSSYQDPRVSEKALLRQGFNVLNPDAPQREQILGFPNSWTAQSVSGYKHDGQQHFRILDRQSRTRGILSVSPETPEENTYHLTPRFSVAVSGSRHKAEVMLSDGGRKLHPLALVPNAGNLTDVRQHANMLAAAVIPNMASPTAYWDVENGHVRKRLTPALRDVFAQESTFGPARTINAQLVDAGEGNIIRPRFHLTTRRYEDHRGFKGQDFILLDDHAVGNDLHEHRLFRLPQNHQHLYGRVKTITELQVSNALPDIASISAYRNMNDREVMAQVGYIRDRLHHVLPNFEQGKLPHTQHRAYRERLNAARIQDAQDDGYRIS
jgi:hypothetical protein